MTEVRPQTAQTDAGWINNMRAAEDAEERVVFDEMNANSPSSRILWARCGRPRPSRSLLRWCGEEGEAVIELDAIDRFIEASARSVGEDRPGQGDANALEEFWKSSERREAERRRREIRAQWFAHFCRMADSHARLASEYERRAEALCEEGEQCA